MIQIPKNPYYRNAMLLDFPPKSWVKFNRSPVDHYFKFNAWLYDTYGILVYVNTLWFNTIEDAVYFKLRYGDYES